MTLNNLNLSNNSAVDGGGLHVDSRSDTAFTGGQVTRNTAARLLRGVYNAGELTPGGPSRVYVQYNHAGTNRGSMYNTWGGVYEPVNAVVAGNTPNIVSEGAASGCDVPIRGASARHHAGLGASPSPPVRFS